MRSMVHAATSFPVSSTTKFPLVSACFPTEAVSRHYPGHARTDSSQLPLLRLNYLAYVNSWSAFEVRLLRPSKAIHTVSFSLHSAMLQRRVSDRRPVKGDAGNARSAWIYQTDHATRTRPR